ncbi:MAG TPA: S8/S53 family peptidase [Mycobacteriales bacterium]|nr:S8/S53 family peptidase [Mycobacteriales bacterium]
MRTGRTGEGEPVASVPPLHPLDDNVLRRHRAKILRPEEAAPAWDGSEVRPTIYRPEWLLVPTVLLTNPVYREFLSTELRRIGLQMAQDSPPGTLPRGRVPVRNERAPQQPVRLVAADGVVLGGPVDSWHAVQVLRAAARHESSQLVELARLISLDHLMFGFSGHGYASIVGAPGSDGHGWGAGRTPVILPLRAPARRDPAVLGHRRPVVAVLDTGCGDHPWLPRRLSTDPDKDEFVEVMPPPTPPPGSPPAPPWQDQDSGQSFTRPLVGELDSHAGHGTFITGIIRQLAPDARVLLYPVMHSDGAVVEQDLLAQLTAIRDRVMSAAAPGGPAKNFIDVVSMSFGWYHEAGSTTFESSIGGLLQQLSDYGVIIVSSAGNDAVAEPPVYPAAFSTWTFPGTSVPRVISVGALTRAPVRAIFSNEASWVNTWYPGCAIISTVPTTFNGSDTPPLSRMFGSSNRVGFDPDDYSYGFGVWDGTSFAAAVCTARAALLLTESPSLTVTTSVAVQRAKKVIDDLLSPDAFFTQVWP